MLLLVKPPRIAESAFHMECELTNSTEVKNDKGVVTSTVVFGRVVMFHVVESMLERSESRVAEVSLNNYRPVGRLGGDSYVKLGDYFDLPRPRIP